MDLTLAHERARSDVAVDALEMVLGVLLTVSTAEINES